MAERWIRIKGRFPKLGMISNIIRGHPVAYRIRIENGGLVLDGTMNAMVVECTVIGSAGAGVKLSQAEDDSGG